jgi:hypothetical protein
MGSGLTCALCDAAIASSEPEFELQFEPSVPLSQTVRFHRECHAIWSDARDELQPTPTEWHTVAQQLPPFGALVEARVSLGEARSIILNAICSSDRIAGGHSWINPMTGGPLPPGWRPIEWRHLPGVGIDADGGAREPTVPKRA